MRASQKRNGQDATRWIAATLSGIFVAVAARLLVGILLYAVYAGVPPLLWASRPPEGTVLATSDLVSLMLMPVIWIGYLLWGGLAGALAWKFRAEDATSKRRTALFLCWGLLLVNSGWFLWLAGVLAGALGRYGPPPGNDWRFALLALTGLLVEPVVTGVGILRMPRWLQYLHEPLYDMLKYGR